jgi:hypothetical protein
MAEEAGFRREPLPRALRGARAGRGKQDTERPLALSGCRSPYIGLVPGRVRMSPMTH